MKEPRLRRETPIDLHESENPTCLRCAGREQRDSRTEDGICKECRSSVDQGLVRCVGNWGQEKVYYLLRYLGIFSNGMHNSWQGLNYIEICSGPGRNIEYKTWREHDGSALAVLSHHYYRYISQALFIDYDNRVVDQLNRRIAALEIGNARAVAVDYHDRENLLGEMRRLPQGHLNLVFVDPTDLSFPFNSLSAITGLLKNVDLILTIPLGTDFNRNAEKASMPKDSNVRAKYCEFLGIPSFFDELRAQDGRPATQMNINELRTSFTGAFLGQLRSIGYSFTDHKRIRHLYDLVFASRNKKGLEFWQKACSIEHNGQRVFPWAEG